MIITCILILCSIPIPSVGAAEGDINAKPKVIPSLQEWTGSTGSFVLTSNTRIVYSDVALKSTATQFTTDLKEMTGRDIPMVSGNEATIGDFLLTLNTKIDSTIGDEGYYFEVGNYVTIRANTKAGVFYGTRTALQILEQDSQKSNIVKGHSKDFPKYPVRGFMLDVGRKFISMDDLKEYVKLMSYYKLNEFQLHLSDNELFSDLNRDENSWSRYAAFRLESTKYPELTAKDGHYTKQEFRELQDLAAIRGLTITPEIDMPSHSLAFTKVRKDLVHPNLPIDHLDISRPETIAFVKDIWDEYLDSDWFDTDRIHFGGDEFDRRDTTQFEVYRKFLNTMNAHIKSKNKTAQMWGSLSQFPGNTVVDNDIVMNAWNKGWQNPKDAIAQGFKIINTDDAQLYMVPKANYYHDYLDKQWLFNNWTPTYFGGTHNLQEGEPNLLGGMFALWNDKLGRVVSAAEIADRVNDAVPVMAEKMWRSQSSGATFAEFNNLTSVIGVGPGVDLFREVKSVGDLVVHYPFEEGASLITSDQSGNAYEGTLKNVTWSDAGKSGKSVVFNGTSDRIVTGLSSKGLPWTISAWVKLDEGLQADEMIFTESKDGALKLKQRGSVNAGFTREGYDYNFSVAIPTGRFVHVAFQGDLSGTSLYIDGELKSKVSDTTILPIEMIGGQKNSFVGSLDEFKIFNRVLTASEIAVEAGSPSWTVNIASGKPATASSLEAPQFTANLAFDGNGTTRWSSGKTDNEWIYVDLGAAMDIKKIVLKWELSFARGYKIQVSDDAVSWRDVFSTTAGAGGVENITLKKAENARYVRMLGTKRAGTYGFSLYEFEVYQSNPNDIPPVQNPIRYARDFEDNSLVGWQQMTGVNVGNMSIVDAPANASLHALKLTANGASNVFVDMNSPNVQDGEIEFKVTPQSTALREGIIFRYVDNNAWASIGFDGGSWYWVNAQDNYGLVTNNPAAALRNGVTSTVKVKYEGSKITLIVDGTTYFEGNLSSLPTEAGKMGARVFGASVAVFDDFVYANDVAEVPVTGVQVDKKTITLQEGEMMQLSALVLPESSTNKKVAWTSNNEAVAKVDVVDGKVIVTAKAAGTADITVTTLAGGFTDTSRVTVLAAATTDLPLSTLTAPSTVQYGETFIVNYGLSKVAEAVYAQDISIQYDVTRMELVSIDSLIDGVSVIEKIESPGSLRLIFASQGGLYGISGDAQIVKLTFKAKSSLEPAIGTIAVVKAFMGHGNGVETDAAPSSANIAFTIAPVELSPDINGDGKVSIGDLAIVAANYGKTKTDIAWEQVKKADVNGDGKIDINDLAIIARKILE
ncbi:family 20 glycosylhydrolase [Paenibacillus sp. CMAA1364]